MNTKNDLDGLHLFQYGVPVGQAKKIGYPADSIKAETAPFIVRELIAALQPATHLDLGCGTGIYVEAFRLQGVDSTGIEGNLALRAHPRAEALQIRFEDLRAPIEFPSPVDLVTCIEVVEHIEADYVDVLVDNLTKPARQWLVITTGEISGGQTPWHLNEQPLEYWVPRIEAKGFAYEPSLSKRLKKIFKRYLRKKGLSWWGNCLAVFRNVQHGV